MPLPHPTRSKWLASAVLDTVGNSEARTQEVRTADDSRDEKKTTGVSHSNDGVDEGRRGASPNDGQHVGDK